VAILGDVEAPAGLPDNCVFLRDSNDLYTRLAK
jgi:hypothetical protein